MNFYQAVRGLSGSDSIGKLRALNLPEMQDGSFLDVGCNEGFFCGAAIASGATRVVGVDNHQPNILQARQHFPAAEFVHADWTEFLSQCSEKFSVILCASAIHYADDQNAFLKQLLNCLGEGGELILECGLGNDADASEGFVTQQRWDGAKKYFTRASIGAFIRECGFHVFREDPSVKQDGDEVPRYVLHIRKTRRTFILNFDNPNTGKSQLGDALAASVRHISIDVFALELMQTELTILRRWMENIDRFWLEIVALDMAPWAAEQIYRVASNAGRHEYIYLEGWLPHEIKTLVLQLFDKSGDLVFLTSRTAGPIWEKHTSKIAAALRPDGVRFITIGSGHIDQLEVHGHTALARGWRINELANTRLMMTVADGPEIDCRILHEPERPDLNGRGKGFVVTFDLPSEEAMKIRKGERPALFSEAPNRIWHRLSFESGIRID